MYKSALDIELALIASDGAGIGRIVFSVSSNVASLKTVVSAAAGHVEVWGGPPILEHMQTSAQAVATITSVLIVDDLTTRLEAWKPLRDRLDALVKLGDSIASVCLVSLALSFNPSY